MCPGNPGPSAGGKRTRTLAFEEEEEHLSSNVDVPYSSPETSTEHQKENANIRETGSANNTLRTRGHIKTFMPRHTIAGYCNIVSGL